MNLGFFNDDLKALFSKKFIEQRYHYHLIGGILLGVLFYYITVEAHYTYARLLLANLIVFLGAVGWELVRGLLYKYQMDWGDVRFSTYGSIIGSLIALFI